MKHRSVTAASLAGVWSPFSGWSPVAMWGPLAGIGVGVIGAPPARGGAVRFTEHVISTTADSAFSVFATDLGGDGDIDVRSASTEDSKIVWYENLSPCGFDADCDGDVDLADFAAFRVAFTDPE